MKNLMTATVGGKTTSVYDISTNCTHVCNPQDEHILEGKVNKWLQCDQNTKDQIRAQV